MIHLQTKTEISRTLDRTPQEIAYDESVKRVLSARYLLAWIMKGCVSEYRNCSIRDIAELYIEGQPQISGTPVHAGEADSRDNTITRYSLAEEQLLGTAEEEQKNYDLLSVVMVCFNDRQVEKRLQNGMAGQDSADLVRLLSVLLSSTVETEEKKQILEEEYSIPMTREIESEVSYMCNLSQGLIEKGVAQGADKRSMEIAAELLKMAMPAESICKVTGISMDQLLKIAEETGLSLTE